MAKNSKEDRLTVPIMYQLPIGPTCIWLSEYYMLLPWIYGMYNLQFPFSSRDNLSLTLQSSQKNSVATLCCELERRVAEQERQLVDQARQFAERERSMQSAISSLTQWVQSQNPNGPPPPIFTWGNDPFSTPPSTTSARQATQGSGDGVIHGLSRSPIGHTSDRSNNEAGGLGGSGEGGGGVDDWLTSPGSRN